MEFQFASRMEQFQPGIFNILDDKRKAMEAAGRKVFNMSIGTPDFPPAPHVMQALCEAAKDPENYKYSLTECPELVDAVKKWYQNCYEVNLQDDELMSIYGSQEGITHIGLALCDPGDIVLVPNPGYPIFEMGPSLCGAKIEYYDLLPENHYLPDLDGFDSELARAAKMMIVSYPLNPLGVAAPREFYNKLVAFAKKYNIIILHDNAYSKIIFDDHESVSFLSIPGAMDVGVEYNSLSKTYNLTGARISFVLGNREIIQKYRMLRSQIDYGIFLPVQKAAVAALNGPQEGVELQRLAYQARRDALCGGLRSIGWDVPDSQGSMFVWAPIPAGYSNSVDFCFDLLEKTGVLCTPGSAFGTLGEGYVRFALTKTTEEIKELVQAVADGGIL